MKLPRPPLDNSTSNKNEPAIVSKYLSDTAEIRDCFKKFRNQRLTMKLKLEATGLEVTCRVLDVTETSFYVEDILPRSALAEFRKQPRFSLSIRDQGTYAFVEGLNVIASHEERGLPYFEIPLPAQMLYQQRRRALRYAIPLRVASRGANITFFRHVDLVGDIIDISVGGCRAAFSGPLLEPIKVDEVVENCAIALPPFLEIHSQGIVRHCHQNREGITTCGIELTDMNITDRRRLEQFIHSLSKQS